MLSSPIADGQALLKARFDNLKEDYEKEYDWETDIVGTAKPNRPEVQFIFEDCGLLLAEIPVDESWKVFAYSADMLQDYENLSELAEVNKRSTLWRF